MKKFSKIILAILLAVWQLIILGFLSFLLPNMATSVVPGWHAPILSSAFVSLVPYYLAVALVIGVVLFIINLRLINWIAVRRQSNSAKE